MKRLKIDTLDKLEAFVNNESVSLEDRLEVFTQATENYPLFILSVKYDDTCTTIENRLEVQEQMKRVIADVKADPNQKSYRGFWVAYEHND